jgi:hypothetical protein
MAPARAQTVVVAGADLRHVAQWAALVLPDANIAEAESTALIDALNHANDGAELVELSRPAAEALYSCDFRAHGYGTRRAIRSTRADCDHCAALGRAIEELIPRLGVQRLKSRRRR